MRLAARARAGMAGMLRAFVHEIKDDRLERSKALANPRGYAHGCLSSTYFASTSDCSTTNRSISPMLPKSLNVAQIFSE